jgi:multisubunit Na+/H+ antiporter MnhE subunit
MAQSKKLSVIETSTNIVIGLIVSFIIQLFLFPFMGIPISHKQNVIITLVFFVASFIRGYLVRRFFNSKSK